MKFGKWLKNELESRKISQMQIYRDTGITQGAISHWIQDVNSPTLDRAGVILDYLGYELVIRKKRGDK